MCEWPVHCRPVCLFVKFKQICRHFCFICSKQDVALNDLVGVAKLKQNGAARGFLILYTHTHKHTALVYLIVCTAPFSSFPSCLVPDQFLNLFFFFFFLLSSSSSSSSPSFILQRQLIPPHFLATVQPAVAIVSFRVRIYTRNVSCYRQPIYLLSTYLFLVAKFFFANKFIRICPWDFFFFF